MLTHVNPATLQSRGLKQSAAHLSVASSGPLQGSPHLLFTFWHRLMADDGHAEYQRSAPAKDRGYLALLIQDVLNSRFDVQNGSKWFN